MPKYRPVLCTDNQIRDMIVILKTRGIIIQNESEFSKGFIAAQELYKSMPSLLDGGNIPESGRWL
jgi:hypothetical protein